MTVIDETNDLNSDFTKLPFEQIMKRLDGAAQALEAGGLGLDDTIKLFENGMKMARVCSEMLAPAELRVSSIKTTYGLSMDYEQEEDLTQEDE
jgi:exodeoxyribonuclease VII small subunit